MDTLSRIVDFFSLALMTLERGFKEKTNGFKRLTEQVSCLAIYWLVKGQNEHAFNNDHLLIVWLGNGFSCSFSVAPLVLQSISNHFGENTS